MRPPENDLTFQSLRTPFAFKDARTGEVMWIEGFWCTPEGRRIHAACTKRGTILRRPDEIPAFINHLAGEAA